MQPSKSRALIPFTLNGTLLCVVLCSLLSRSSRFLMTVPEILFGMEQRAYYDTSDVPLLVVATLSVLPLFAWSGWVMLRRAARHAKRESRPWLPLLLESALLGAVLGGFFFGVRVMDAEGVDMGVAAQVIPVMVLSVLGATLSSMWLMLAVQRELS